MNQEEGSTLQALLDLSGVLTTSDSLAICRTAVDMARRLLRLDRVSLLRPDGAGARLAVHAAVGWPEGMAVPLGAGGRRTLSGHVFACREAAVVEDFAGEARFHVPPEVPGAGVRSAICVPMVSGGETVGVLAGQTLVRRRFSEPERHLLQAIANHAAAALRAATDREALAASREQLKTLLDATPDGIFLKDGQGRWLEANPAGLAMFELDGVDYRGKTVAELAGRSERYREVLLSCQLLDQKAWRERTMVRGEEALPARDGGQRCYDVIKVPLFHAGGGRRGLVVVWRDITERKRQEQRLRLAGEVFENSAEGIMILDVQGRLVSVNRAYTQITGHPAEQAIGRRPSLMLSARQDAAFYRGLWSALTERGHWQGELLNRRRNGEVYPQWLTMNAVRNEHGETTHYLGIFADLTEHKEAESRIHQLANHDPLTGLPNRRLFQDRLEQALVQASRHGRRVAILFVDLDRFKVVNESLGHDAGDRLLGEAARRLAACVRAEDTAARLGSDEFAVLMPDAGEAQNAAQVAGKLIAALGAGAYRLGDQEVHITPSIGIGVSPEDARDAAGLMRHADTALEFAKGEGGNQYRFYRADMNATAIERLSLETALRRAVDRGDFLLHYQPQLDTNSGRLLGMEALIRWRHPERGIVSPAEFIPLAEQAGLIEPIGEWVLRQACLQHGNWQRAGYDPIPVAVNLSARQFRRGNLLKTLERTLDETGMDPRMLELELTEGLLMEHTEETVATLRKLSDLGLKVAVDDFGIGYSSLSYLKRFPIDKLKVDQSFIRDIGIDPDDAAIVTAIIAMAHGLKLRVIAEGVETVDQLTFLRSQDCDAVQGFYFSPPVAAEGLARMLPRGAQGRPVG